MWVPHTITTKMRTKVNFICIILAFKARATRSRESRESRGKRNKWQENIVEGGMRKLKGTRRRRRRCSYQSSVVHCVLCGAERSCRCIWQLWLRPSMTAPETNALHYPSPLGCSSLPCPALPRDASLQVEYKWPMADGAVAWVAPVAVASHNATQMRMDRSC